VATTFFLFIGTLTIVLTAVCVGVLAPIVIDVVELFSALDKDIPVPAMKFIVESVD
jgi:hypothetical protein